MKGAIGNAFILNMVITFIVIFYMLLIGSVAFSKSYKINKYLHDKIAYYAEANAVKYGRIKNEDLRRLGWEDDVNQYLSRVGYILSYQANTCPNKEKSDYEILRDTSVGSYDYCLYRRKYSESPYETDFADSRTTYMVLSYMKFDFPIVGEFIKIPITSETKTITRFH